MGRMEGASFWRAVEGAGSSGPSVADGRASSVEGDGCAMTSEGESCPVRSERSPRLDRGGLKKATTDVRRFTACLAGIGHLQQKKVEESTS